MAVFGGGGGGGGGGGEIKYLGHLKCVGENEKYTSLCKCLLDVIIRLLDKTLLDIC